MSLFDCFSESEDSKFTTINWQFCCSETGHHQLILVFEFIRLEVLIDGITDCFTNKLFAAHNVSPFPDSKLYTSLHQVNIDNLLC